jgi:hypothetical protein
MPLSSNHTRPQPPLPPLLRIGTTSTTAVFHAILASCLKPQSRSGGLATPPAFQLAFKMRCCTPLTPTCHTTVSNAHDMSPTCGTLRYPGDHPNLDQYFVPAPPPANMRVSIGFYHPDVDSSYAVGTTVSNRHPSVQSSLAAYLPSGHPNCDTCLANPSAHPMPSWHPQLSALITRRSKLTFTVDTSSYHPNVTNSFVNRSPMPAAHVSVQNLMASVLGSWHPNVDDILRNPASNPMPASHPKLEEFILRGAGPRLPEVSIGFYHPSVDASYAAGTPYSSTHPLLQPTFAASLPSGHPNVDTLLANPGAHPLPTLHPDLSTMVMIRPEVTFAVSVLDFHVNVDTSFAAAAVMPTWHPSVAAMFASVVDPAWHPNIDVILQVRRRWPCVILLRFCVVVGRSF